MQWLACINEETLEIVFIGIVLLKQKGFKPTAIKDD